MLKRTLRRLAARQRCKCVRHLSVVSMDQQRSSTSSAEAQFYEDEDDEESNFCTFIFGYLKGLIWFITCFLILFLADYIWNLQEQLENSKESAEKSWTGSIPYIAISCTVVLVKCLNGPGISKSLLTWSLTVLYWARIEKERKFNVIFWRVWLVDWSLDICMSLCQLWVAAPKQSTSLYFFFELFIYFVYIFHWSPFLLAIVWLAPLGDDAKPFKYGIGFVLFIHVLWHVCMRWQYKRENPPDWRRHFMVHDDLRGQRNEMVEDYDKVIDTYFGQKRGLYLAMTKFWYYQSIKRSYEAKDSSWYWPCCLRVVKKEGDVVEAKKMSPEQCWAQAGVRMRIGVYLLCIVYTILSELVNMLDAVFLLCYYWGGWTGISLVMICTAADFDRYVTIKSVHHWLKTGDLKESVTYLLVWKFLKQPIGFMIGYLHARFVKQFWHTISYTENAEIPEYVVMKNCPDDKANGLYNLQDRLHREKLSTFKVWYENKYKYNIVWDETALKWIVYDGHLDTIVTGAKKNRKRRNYGKLVVVGQDNVSHPVNNAVWKVMDTLTEPWRTVLVENSVKDISCERHDHNMSDDETIPSSLSSDISPETVTDSGRLPPVMQPMPSRNSSGSAATPSYATSTYITNSAETPSLLENRKERGDSEQQ